MTILSNMLDAIGAAGVRDVVIVVGYRREMVIEAARRWAGENGRTRLTFIENDRFDDTNTLGSLHLARDHLAGSVLYFNADVWFDPRIVLELAGETGRAGDGAAPVALLAVEEKRCGAEEVKVLLGEGSRVAEIGKELDPAACLGEFIGIARFDEPATSALRASLDLLAGSHGDTFFEFALDAILDDVCVGVWPIAPGSAVEIDTPEDWETAKGLSGWRGA